MKGPWLGNIATFKEYRAKGGLIGFAPDPRTGHECGDSRYLAIPFLDACLAMRLPDKGSKDQTLKPMDNSKGVARPFLGDEASHGRVQGNPEEALAAERSRCESVDRICKDGCHERRHATARAVQREGIAKGRSGNGNHLECRSGF
jgi:hypothetical protein